MPLLLTWKPDNWPHENIVRMVKTIEENGTVTEDWRTAAHNQTFIGDRAYLLKQGSEPRGIFGIGTVAGSAKSIDPSNPQGRKEVPVRFTQFVDPERSQIISFHQVEKILNINQINSQQSGVSLSDGQADALDQLFFPSVADIDWTTQEIDLVVADYFEMLRLEILDQPYSKTDHRRELLKNIQRTSGSIEFKHQNISAVLQELGFPWISGYKPGKNYQAALFKAVARYAGKNLAIERQVAIVPSQASIDPEKAFVDPPSGINPKNNPPKENAAIIRKFDVAKRDAKNRALGEEGERFVFELEKERLRRAKRPDLADRVRWVSKDDGDGAGYDIQSFNSLEQEIHIEVKTTRGGKNTPFYISHNEVGVARKLKDRFLLYRVFSFGREAYVYVLSGPLEGKLSLQPINYRASVAN